MGPGGCDEGDPCWALSSALWVDEVPRGGWAGGEWDCPDRAGGGPEDFSSLADLLRKVLSKVPHPSPATDWPGVLLGFAAQWLLWGQSWVLNWTLTPGWAEGLTEAVGEPAVAAGEGLGHPGNGISPTS